MSKKIHITESQYNQLIGEMAYPSSFDFNVFKSLTSFNKRMKYCEQHLTRISSGSSRIVYLIDDDKVLKLAKNQKGIAQNNVEISLGNERYYTCFADVYDYDNDGLWLEMEFCRKAKKSVYHLKFYVMVLQKWLNIEINLTYLININLYGKKSSIMGMKK